MTGFLLAAAFATFGVGARVERSMRVSTQGAKVTAPREARVVVRREPRRVLVTVQR